MVNIGNAVVNIGLMPAVLAVSAGRFVLTLYWVFGRNIGKR